MKIRIAGDEFEFEFHKIRAKEAMAIESVTGMTTMEWWEAYGKGNMTAATAFVWLLRRRREPGLKFSDVDFEIGDVELVQDEEEPAVGEAAAPDEGDSEESPRLAIATG